MSLVWYKADAYHLKSSCGRFSIARLSVDTALWYVAFHLKDEIGANRVPIAASPEERARALEEVKALCEAEAGVLSPPTAEEGDENRGAH